MVRKILLVSALILLAGAGVFVLGRYSVESRPSQQGPLTYSLSPGPISMLGGGAGYMFDYNTPNPIPREDLEATIDRFLVRLDNPELALGNLREFQFAYQAEIIEQSTGRHAFGLMIGKGSAAISPKAGPNVFWNTRYGPLIAEIGGGYGMVGRLLFQDTEATGMPLSEAEARRIGEEAIASWNSDLSLEEGVDTFYGFYEYHLLRDGRRVGELDVNGYSGQVWYKDWGEPQIQAQN